MKLVDLLNLTGFGPGKVSYGSDFFNSKVTRLCAGVFLGSLTAAVQGGVTWREAIYTSVVAALVAFLKDAAVKVGEAHVAAVIEAGATKVGRIPVSNAPRGVVEPLDADAEYRRQVKEALGNGVGVGSTAPVSNTDKTVSGGLEDLRAIGSAVADQDNAANGGPGTVEFDTDHDGAGPDDDDHDGEEKGEN